MLLFFLVGCAENNQNQEISMNESQEEQLKQEYKGLIGSWRRINDADEVFVLSKSEGILYMTSNQEESRPLVFVSMEKIKGEDAYYFIDEEKKKGYNFFLENEETLIVNSSTTIEGMDSLSPPIEYIKTAK